MVIRFLQPIVLLIAMMGWTNVVLSQTAQPTSSELELIVYERAGCAWCARWDQEIAPIYPRAEIGQKVPMRRVSLDKPTTSDPVLGDPVRYTPTFVLLREGKEIGRITGYHNDAFFWGLLESMVERIPKKQNEKERP
jgi:thioredoxin-related protein